MYSQSLTGGKDKERVAWGGGGEVYIALSLSYHLLNSFSQFDNSDTGITIRADLINPASNMPARNDMT